MQQKRSTIPICDLCGERDQFQIIYKEIKNHPEHSPERDVYKSSSSGFASEQVVSCRSCGLIFLNPRLDASAILKGYSQAIDSDYVSQGDARIQTFRKSVQFFRSFVKKKNSAEPLPSTQPLRVLDVGAGAGFFVKAAQDEGLDAMGIEPSEWLVKWGTQNLGVKLIDGTLSDFLLKHRLESFEWITLWDVLEHTESPKKELANANQVLKRGGWLTVNYPDISSILARAFGRKWWFLLSVHLYYFTPRTIRRYLEEAGFEIVYMGRHFQKLNLGYLAFRAEQYLPRLGKIAGSVLRSLHLSNIPVTYYASQRIVMAQKIKESA